MCLLRRWDYLFKYLRRSGAEYIFPTCVVRLCAPSHLYCHSFSVLEHSQHVFTHKSDQLAVGPSSFHQLGYQIRILVSHHFQVS